MKIGELAKLAGCQVVTVRYYEKEGLLKLPSRTRANYRLYDEADLERLRFILHCRRHGINLAEIRQLLALREHPGTDCAFAHKLISQHLNYVEEQIDSLLRLREELKELNIASGCEKGECIIMARLDAAGDCPYCNQSAAEK